MYQQKIPSREFEVEFDKHKIDYDFFVKHYSKGDQYQEGVNDYIDDKGKQVVVKVSQWYQEVQINYQQMERQLKSFDNEYKILIKLNGKYPDKFPICKWTENLTQKLQSRYIIMERADTSLDKFLNNNRNLSYEEKYLLMNQVWEIVIILQKEGISHRDLKPAQFLLFQCKEGFQVKLTDFGSYSRRYKYIVGQNTEVESLILFITPQFLSPELTKAAELGREVAMKQIQNVEFISSILQIVFRMLKDKIKKKDPLNLNKIIQLIWHQFDSFAVGKILLEIFGKGFSNSCEKNIKTLENLLINIKTEKEKQWIVRMILLQQQSPQYRLTIQQIDKIESQDKQDYLQNVKGTWIDIYKYFSDSGIELSKNFPNDESQLQKVKFYIETLQASSLSISQKSRTDEQNPIINIGSQERPIVEEQKQQQPLQQQQPQQVITEVQNYQTHFQNVPPVYDDPLLVLLAQVIYNAGRGQGKDGLEMVASTLLNRQKLNKRYLGGQNFEKIIDNNNGYKQQMAQEVSDSNKKTDQYQYSLTLARQLVNKEFQDTTGVGATHFSNKRDGFKSIEKDKIFTYQKQLGALYLFREH